MDQEWYDQKNRREGFLSGFISAFGLMFFVFVIFNMIFGSGE